MGKRKRVNTEELHKLKKQLKLLQDSVNILVNDNASETLGEPEDNEDSLTEDMSDHEENTEDQTNPGLQSTSNKNDNLQDKQSNDLSTTEQDTNNTETPINEDFVEIFGLDPNASKAIESKLHPGILSRWKYWASKGLNDDDVDKLLDKYQSPSGLEEPKLNPEILLKLAKHSKTRDSHMARRQRLAGAALTSLGSAMSTLMEETESIDKIQFMERLNDAGKILTEIFHSQTESRIAFILAGVDKETKTLLEDKQTEEFLFGRNLTERIKEAKAMDKVASSIKKQQPKQKFAQSKSPLNFNSQYAKWPTPGTSGTQQGYQNRQRLQFRTKQPFNPRSQYQGPNRQKNQARYK